jgi:hypothetical protein
MYTRKAYATREAQGVVRDDQPDAREGQAGRPGVRDVPYVDVRSCGSRRCGVRAHELGLRYFP